MSLKHTLAIALFATTLAQPAAFAVTADDTAIKAGTTVSGKLDSTLDSGKNQDGDKFTVSLQPGWFQAKNVKGAKLEGHVEGVKSAAKFGKKGAMSLVFDDLVTSDGKTEPVQVRLVSAVKPQTHKLRNAAIIVGGAIAGHHLAKKAGKKHGGLMGAAAATAVVLSMPGGNIVLPKASTIKVKFDAPVDLGASRL
jgi:hypothetical protein